MRLADDRRAIAGLVEHGGDRRRVDGERDAVHPHAVGARVLAGDDRRPRRHAHDRLRVGALVPVSGGGERVDDGCAGERATVAAERVEALLIGGDEQDLATHQRSPSEWSSAGASVSIWRRSSSSAPAVRTADHEGHRPRVGLGRVDDDARRIVDVEAEVDDVDRAAVVADHGRREPVLEPTLDRVDDEDLLGHREPGVGRDQPARAVDGRRRDAREPLVQPRRVADELPDIVGRSPDRGSRDGSSRAPRGPYRPSSAHWISCRLSSGHGRRHDVPQHELKLLEQCRGHCR